MHPDGGDGGGGGCPPFLSLFFGSKEKEADANGGPLLDLSRLGSVNNGSKRISCSVLPLPPPPVLFGFPIPNFQWALLREMETRRRRWVPGTAAAAGFLLPPATCCWVRSRPRPRAQLAGGRKSQESSKQPGARPSLHGGYMSTRQPIVRLPTGRSPFLSSSIERFTVHPLLYFGSTSN